MVYGFTEIVTLRFSVGCLAGGDTLLGAVGALELDTNAFDSVFLNSFEKRTGTG